MKMVPFFPPTHQHVLEVRPCQYTQLYLILDCCVVFRSLFKMFPYGWAFRLLPGFPRCKQGCNAYHCMRFLVHTCGSLAISLERMRGDVGSKARLSD